MYRRLTGLTKKHDRPGAGNPNVRDRSPSNATADELMKT